jgi:transcriptional regulator with XRE-family HTH domain
MVYATVTVTGEAIGPRIKRQRRKLGLTLDEVAGRTGISKPYLSLIENGRVANPPSDDKLRRIEQSLGFGAAELIGEAHLQRTPQDVRALLMKLSGEGAGAPSAGVPPETAGEREVVSRSKLALAPLTQSVGWPDLIDKQAFAARVCDDAMTPKYRLGDIVVFSPALAARGGDDCFVRLTDGTTTFQRVFFESTSDGDPTVRLQPRNESRPPTIVESQQIATIYRAVYKYERVDEV